MNIGIIGGGAVGMLFAGFLSDRHEVTLYTRTKEQASAINGKGLQILRGHHKKKKNVKAVHIQERIEEEDLLIVAVKQYDLGSALSYIQTNKSPLLFVQNGFAHVERVSRLHNEYIYLGVVEHGARRHDLHTVEHTGTGLTKIAAYRGSIDKLDFLMEHSEEFPFSFLEDYHKMLIEKLVVNAVINPLTAILGVKNGDLLSNPYFHELFQRLFNEIAIILELEPASLYQEHIEHVCRATSNNQSSMLKDLERGKQTEIDSILGYILSAARTEGKPHQLTHTLYTMVKGREKRGED
ncbi:2-dehydropantoate 2-reductase [Peribacillus sp. SCS-155]|uniref:2-dehydropantoate 2-reductase n=1 Tax=Peribacillus sedimenti TaxID=3115297 RepID=UPI0039064D7C